MERHPTEKHVAIITGNDVVDVLVAPSTSTADVRTRLGLPREFMLSRRDGLPFGEDEDLFGQVRDGEKLYASAPATVGA